jgi:hypothetical protein
MTTGRINQVATTNTNILRHVPMGQREQLHSQLDSCQPLETTYTTVNNTNCNEATSIVWGVLNQAL